MKSKQVQFIQTTPEQLTENILKGVDCKLKEFFEKHKPPEEEVLLTVKETAEILQCSKKALDNWKNNGVLSSYRLGGRVYYKKSDIYSKLVKQ